MILFRGSVAASSGAGRDVHPYWWKVTTDPCAERHNSPFFVNASAMENLDAANSGAALKLDSALRYSAGRPAITER